MITRFLAEIQILDSLQFVKLKYFQKKSIHQSLVIIIYSKYLQFSLLARYHMMTSEVNERFVKCRQILFSYFAHGFPAGSLFSLHIWLWVFSWYLVITGDLMQCSQWTMTYSRWLKDAVNGERWKLNETEWCTETWYIVILRISSYL